MKLTKLILLSTIITLSSGCILEQFDSPEKVKEKFDLSITQKNYGAALDFAKKLSEKEPQKYDSFLALAQAYAQTGDKSAAISALSNAIKLGLNDAHKIINDPLLDPIKQSAGFAELMSEKLDYQEQELDSIALIMKEREAKADSLINDTTTSITDKDGKTVIKAGDLEIEVDNELEK